MKQNFFLVVVIAFGGFYYYMHHKKNKPEVISREVVENYQLDLNSKEMPKVLRVFADCSNSIAKKCEVLGGTEIKGRSCIYGDEKTMYMPIYKDVDENCKVYLGYYRLCSRYWEKLCGKFHFRSTLRCMHQNRDKIDKECSQLLDKILKHYKVDQD